MERYPEFATKGETATQQMNVFQVSKEDMARQEKVATDMLEVHRVLARGNPNVITPERDTVDSGAHIEENSVAEDDRPETYPGQR